MKKSALIGLVVFLVTMTTVHSATYNVTDLGTLGGQSSRATAINEAGEVVGYSWVSGNTTQHAYLYSNGSMRNLDTMGGIYSEALGINDSGKVVGRILRDGYWNAFTYKGDSMSYVYPVPGTLNEANGINNSGQIVGNGRGGMFLATDSHNWNFLPVIGNDPNRVAGGINSRGNIIGHKDYMAFIYYADGTIRNLGTLGGYASSVRGINDSDQVVGWAYTSDNTLSHAFLYSGGSMTGLNLDTGTESQAYGINESGQIVGFFSTERNEASHRAFLYENGTMKDLNGLIDPDSGWLLRDATAINDLGQIVGYGINPLGQEHAFLLTQIPEPTTVLFPIGMVTFALWLKRRNV